jgi:heparan-alpha-glucosaminide N-acetyltransferase
MSIKTNRLLSIDAFRAITMLLMIFVNDVSGVSNIPAWIEHVRGDEDGLGFADTVFPTFLFIVGLSIPYAIGYRIQKQQSFLKIETHIVLRSVALIVMGFFHVNLESYSSAAVLPYAVWEIIITLSFFLIWMDYPETLSKATRYTLTGMGIALLALMAYLYKGGDADHPHGMRQEWGGILGIIGWAYLVSATVYLLIRGRFAWLLAVLLVFLAINLGTHRGWFPFWLWIIGDASSITLILGGAFMSALYSRLLQQGRLNVVWPVFTGIGIGAIALGFLVRPYTGGISKIGSTPAWVLICGGIGILVFTLLIFLVDVKGKFHWFRIIKPAGTSTLTCYLMPYLLYSLYSLTGFHYPHWFSSGIGGIIRSFAVAFVLIILVGFLEKKKLRLKI